METERDFWITVSFTGTRQALLDLLTDLLDSTTDLLSVQAVRSAGVADDIDPFDETPEEKVAHIDSQLRNAIHRL